MKSVRNEWPVRNDSACNVVDLLKWCTNQRDLRRGSALHAYIRKHKFLEKDSLIASNLVNMYAKCGAFEKAEQLLEELSIQDVSIWNALIAGYTQQGRGGEALRCYENMQRKGHPPGLLTLTCALKACGSIAAATRGEQIHSKIVSLGLLEKDAVLGTTLVDMYARCGALAKAEHVLEEIPVRNVVTWTALIAGYVQQGRGEEALICFDSMQYEGHNPDAFAFTCALKACGSMGAAAKGDQIHESIVRMCLLEKDIVLGSALVDMYVRCGALVKAQRVLQELPARNVVTWTALIAGYAQHGQGEEALKCFNGMQREGLSPDSFTFSCLLKACASLGAAAKGEQIHEKIVSLGMLKKNIVLGSILVDMYARCGALTKARQVLEELPTRDVVMWTTLIAGYIQHGQGEEALKCFDNMQYEGHWPNAVTFTCALKACGSIGAAAKGEEIHGKIVCLGMLQKDPVLGSMLADMYARCGAVAKSQQVLEELLVHDVVTWTVLVAGYAQLGQSVGALNCFERMQSKGMKPSSNTLSSMLNAYGNSGLLDMAEMLFSRMNDDYGIIPDVEHYCCMVDLFARAGKFNKALQVIEKMPSTEYLPMWFALLGACHKWGDVNIGRFAFERALLVDKKDVAIHVCMANIYAVACMHEDFDEIELMKLHKDCLDDTG